MGYFISIIQDLINREHRTKSMCFFKCVLISWADEKKGLDLPFVSFNPYSSARSAVIKMQPDFDILLGSL